MWWVQLAPLNVWVLLPVLVDMLIASPASAPPRESAGGGGSSFDPDTALRVLYDEHALYLLGYAERFAADRGSAEDAVQETFLRAWRNLPRILGDDRPVRAWLLRVIRRVLIDAARAAAVRPMPVAEDAVPERAVDGGFDRVLDSWVLTDALARLTPEHRHVLVEVIYRGTPAHLIAARLGVPPSTVRSRVHYARRELSRLLHVLNGPLDPAACPAEARRNQAGLRRGTAVAGGVFSRGFVPLGSTPRL